MASAAAHEPDRATQAELARLLGVSRQGIHDLVKRKILPIDADGKIDVVLARVALAERVRPSAKTNAPTAAAAAAAAAASAAPTDDTNAALSYHVAKALREEANARRDQLLLRKMQGELTEIAKLDDAIFTAARMLRDMVLNVPKRISADVVASGDARVAEIVMSDALRAAVTDFLHMARTKMDLQAPEEKDFAA